MAGNQATLGGETTGDGEDETVAQELADGQQSISIAEFFERNKHMLGFGSPGRALFTAIKEGVDNGLDAAEEAGIVPRIDVTVEEAEDYYRLVVEDNGPGITKNEIPKVFGQLLYGSRFHRRAQARGQQGIGISAAVLYSQLTTGNSTTITSRTGENQDARKFELNIDTENNDPVVETESVVEWEKSHGTRIEFTIEANLRARSQVHEYIQNTSIANPHATVSINEPKLDERQVYERVDGVSLPDPVEEIPPHPHGVELGTLQDMLEQTDGYSLSGFLQTDFTRVGQKTADRILSRFKQLYYGRELCLDLEAFGVESDELESTIVSSVNNKPKELCNRIGEDVTEHVQNHSPTPSHLETYISECCREAQQEFDTRVGGSVQQAVFTAVCETVTRSGSVTEFVTDCVTAATSKRKSDEQCQSFSETLTHKFLTLPATSVEDLQVSKKQLEIAVEETSQSLPNTWGETARENVVNEVWSRLSDGDHEVPNVSSIVSEQEAIEALLEGMQNAKVSRPPSKCLSPIGEETVEAGLKNNYDADFFAAATRSASAHGGDPFIVEAGLAYGGERPANESIDVDRFANRVPLVYQSGGCAITNVLKQIDWNNYQLSQSSGSLPEGPVVVTVHVASTNVPFTSESKDAVASIEEIEQEIERAVRKVARKMKKFTKKQQRMENRRKRENITSRIIPEVAEKFAGVVGEEAPDTEDTMARILNNVLVHRETVSDGEYQVTVKNFTNKQQSFTLQEVGNSTDSLEATTEETALVEREEGEAAVQVDIALGSMDDETFQYRYTGEGEPRLEVEDIADTLVSIRRD